MTMRWRTQREKFTQRERFPAVTDGSSTCPKTLCALAYSPVLPIFYTYLRVCESAYITV